MKISKMFKLILMSIFIISISFLVSCEMEPDVEDPDENRVNDFIPVNRSTFDIEKGVLMVKEEVCISTNYLPDKTVKKMDVVTYAHKNKDMYEIRKEYKDSGLGKIYKIDFKSRKIIDEIIELSTNKPIKKSENKVELHPIVEDIDPLTGEIIQYNLDMVKSMYDLNSFADNGIQKYWFKATAMKTGGEVTVTVDEKGYVLSTQIKGKNGVDTYTNYQLGKVGNVIFIASTDMVVKEKKTVGELLGDTLAEQINAEFDYTEGDFIRYDSYSDLVTAITGGVMYSRTKGPKLVQVPHPDLVNGSSVSISFEKHVSKVSVEMDTYDHDGMISIWNDKFRR
jgi:hypothetical protein